MKLIEVSETCPVCGSSIKSWLGGRERGRAWSVAEYACGHVFGTAAPVERHPRVNLELAGMMSEAT